MGSVQARPDQANSGSAAESVPTSAQFYSFTQSGLSTAELIYEMEAAGYDYFEPFTISDDSDVDAITDAIDETGVGMSSAHQGLDETLDDPEAVAERYLQYGEPALIEPYIGPDTWSTESSVLDLAHDVNTAADHMADHGLEFGYHNHNHEFQQLDDADETGYDVFAEAVEDHVHLQLDVGWVETGGANPTEYISRYKDKISSIHMKNMEDGGFVEIDERRQHESRCQRRAGGRRRRRRLPDLRVRPSAPADRVDEHRRRVPRSVERPPRRGRN